jgi:GrpB-like predicted nucleotidyltransferase (UPF0157 family)
MATSVAIVAYREAWPAEFRELAESLRAALGDRALRIDHIGSTAVPGLAAKDVIDVQVTVADLAVVPAEIAGLEARGIHDDHPPPGFAGDPAELAKRFFRRRAPARDANVHIRQAGRLNQRYALLCRDYLRASPAAAAAYAAAKRALAAHFADVDTYADVKDPVVDLLMAGAEDWAAATGWQPGPSDA